MRKTSLFSIIIALIAVGIIAVSLTGCVPPGEKEEGAPIRAIPEATVDIEDMDEGVLDNILNTLMENDKKLTSEGDGIWSVYPTD